MGSEVDADGVSVRVVLMSVWKPVAGVVRCCMVVGVLILSCSAGAVTASVVRGQEGLAVSMAVFVHGAKPEGRRGRLAACAPSAEGPSWFPGIAWEKKNPKNKNTIITQSVSFFSAWSHQSSSHPLGQFLIQVMEI